ncbi:MULTISPECIES: DUF5937 family protein [Kitasatospora]|uniref:Putative ArsR family transcriptional regulator n=1 Tax=Kitasatospora setae (strain ATCC 33774 / DSM 43861 / JCM 3304 / KCC A-0304 / NBRC 14216 / KM-6054) TaxID=452652 RepID=E4NJW4_KITSK|nr:DUF5937 family protein [Kitasatospora setae]BAJ33262.1 putative ArsR family transcriptional regulator [Kitasatospora setae KM-6054]
MTLRIDLAGTPPERIRFGVSPLAELTAMLHVLASPEHHPQLAGWAAGVWAGLRPELAERLREAEFLWRSSRADFLLPARPRATLAAELDDVDALDDERYARTALVTTCGSNRRTFAGGSPLHDPVSRASALDLAQARGPVQEAFTERLLDDPAAVRARVRETLELCAEAFFDAEWPALAARLGRDVRDKAELRRRQGLAAALAEVSAAVAVSPDGGSLVLDKLQDSTGRAGAAGVTFLPSVFGHPHLVVVHAPGWQPVVQYPAAGGEREPTVPLETVSLRLEALAHPVRLRLVRSLARASHTTGELAATWGLSAPEVSRHLAVLRRAGLLAADRRGRHVHHVLDLAATGPLGTDLLSAVLR